MKTENQLIQEAYIGMYEMNADEREKFNAADKVVHKVEDQWHYPIMTKHGFEPITKTGIGFVRGYEYKHPQGHSIVVTTGASADYFNDHKNDKHGYWADLEPHVKQLTQNK